MPIEVQWGMPASPGLAGLAAAIIASRDRQAALASQASRDRLRMAMAGGGARGVSASDQMEIARYQADLQARQQAQQWELQQQEMQRKAELERQNFDYKLTQKQRQEYAQNENARQMVRSSPDFTPEQKSWAEMAINLRQAGVSQPSAIPKDPNQPEWPVVTDINGNQVQTGPGVYWTDAEGSQLTMRMNSKGQPETHLLVRPDQTEAARQRKAEEEHQKAISSARARYAGTQLKGEKEGVTTYRPPNEDEITDYLERAFPELKEQREAKDAAVAEKNRIAEEEKAARLAAMPWWEKPAAMAIKVPGSQAMHRLQVEEADKALPQQVGYASAIKRTLENIYGPDKIPESLREIYMHSNMVVREFFRRIGT